HHHAHHLVGFAQAALELFAILNNIHRFLGDAGFHGSASHGGSLPNQHARIEGLGNDVIGPKGEALHAVSAADAVGHVLLGQRGEGAGGSQLHFFVDGGSVYIEGTAEDEGEAEHIVNLVGIIGAPGGHNDVGADGAGFVVGDFGIGVGHSEDNWFGGHGADHVRGKGALHRQADEHVAALDGFRQGTKRSSEGEALLVGIHTLLAAGVNHAFGVGQDDVLTLHAEANVVFRAGDPRRSCPIHDQPHIADVFADQLQAVQQGGSGNDGGAMLVVVEDGNLHRLLQGFLD